MTKESGEHLKEVRKTGYVPRRPGDACRRLEDLCRIMPVDFLQERFDGPCRLLVGIEHVLIECPDPQRPEQVRNPLVHLFREDRVGSAHQDDADILRPVGRLTVERSPFCERGFMEGDRLVIRAGDPEEAYPRLDCREHPVELHLGAEHGIEVVDEGGEDPLFIGLASYGTDEGRSVLGIVAVLPPEPFLPGPPLQGKRGKDIVAPGKEPVDVTVEGRQGGAEFCLGEPFSLPDWVPASLARHGLDAEPVEKILPEGELIGQVERRGQADGDPAAGFPPA